MKSTAAYPAYRIRTIDYPAGRSVELDFGGAAPMRMTADLAQRLAISLLVALHSEEDEA